MNIEKDIEILKAAVERNMEGMVLNVVADFGKAYLIGIAFKDETKGQVMDPYYLVEKKTYRLAGFSPTMDIEKFKTAIKKPLYVRNK